MISSSEPFALDLHCDWCWLGSSPLLSSSSFLFESTISHLPLLDSPFNVMPLQKRFNWNFICAVWAKATNYLIVTLLVLLKTRSEMPSA
jgi:hypothetical protein